MAKVRLNKRMVDAAAASDQDAFFWDSDLAGFGVKVTPLGLKVYVLQYRVGGGRGRSRRITIGRHGSPWTPDQARAKLCGFLAKSPRAPIRPRSERRIAKPTHWRNSPNDTWPIMPRCI